ncbi:hypothetical protein [Haladaptatus sp. DJG-WS-42]|uniref:hypothetical protein n=1 Tax=Haladaptatus sp. DJG-WS-42 TaxID=3120516 RepID=UPI0030D1368A
MSDADQSTTAVRTASVDDLPTYLYWGALVGLALLAAIATLQFYFSVGRIISIWVARDYQPVFQAVFNLIILLLTGIGISLIVTRLRNSE